MIEALGRPGPTRFLLAALVAVFPPGPPSGLAQAPDLRFQRLAHPDLSHNSVYAITEDADGFLWIGTADGLNRYDGYEFRVYRHDPGDSTSLPANVVHDLHLDDRGRLWVATAGGLARFAPREDRFARFALRSGPSEAGARQVYDLFEDRSGRLWAGTDAGMYLRDGEGDRFTPFLPDLYPGGPGEGRLVAAREDPRGRLWMLAEERGSAALWRVGGTDDPGNREAPSADVAAKTEPGNGADRFEVSAERGPVFAFLVDRSGRPWLDGTGPAVLDEEGRRVRPPHGAKGLSPAWAFHEGSDGVVWIGAEDGVHRYDPASGEITHHLPDPAGTAYIFNHVRALYEDRSGTLWVGTHGGLYRADPHAKPFRHLAGEPANPRGLSSRSISAVHADAEALWLGTLGGGLNRVDRRDGTVRRYRHDPSDPATLRSDLIWALHGGEDGILWIGTGEGLSRLDPRTERFRELDLPSPPGGTAAPFVRDVARDASGHLWLATGDGLYRLDPRSGDARRYALDGGDSGLEGDVPESVLPGDGETVWIGGASGDLLRLDPEPGTVERHPLVTEEGERLRSEGVWDLHIGPERALWLGTGSGLSRFDPSTETFRHWLPGDGLPGSVVYSLLVDASGRLWMGTNAGLSRFDPAAAPGEAFRNYDAADGIGSTEFNRRAAFAAEDGEFFFGGLDGLTSFFPPRIRDNPYVPPVVLTRVETSSRRGTRSYNPRSLESLVLSHRDYSLSVEVAALSFTNPTRNRYAFRLEGFDEDWVETGTRHFVRYTNIPPGDYLLRARGSNNDGLWNEEGLALPLTVTPPFWATWWFRGALLLLLGGALFGAYRIRVGRLLEIERLRLRIAGDLHDELSSNLTAIALMGEMVQRRASLASREERRLAGITETARGMVEGLRDIVWLVDPAHDQLEDLLLKMRDVASSLLGGHEVEFRTDAHRLSARLGLAFRRQVFLIYKEILHNIVRHARATSVSIDVEESGGRFRLAVRDDGVGFDPETVADGLGLRSLRSRARELGGSLRVTSRPGEGTEIELRAPVA